MEEYPRTLQELEERFMTEEACREYLARLRWGRGFVCPACDGTEAWATRRGLWMCTVCGHQASVMAGTIFEGTRTPLTLWFRAIWWVVSQKGCVATSGLRRQDGPPLASTVPGPPSCPATIRSNGASSNPPSSSSAFGGTCGMP